MGIIDFERETLNITVKTSANWSLHALRAHLVVPSGPAAFLNVLSDSFIHPWLLVGKYPGWMTNFSNVEGRVNKSCQNWLNFDL